MAYVCITGNEQSPAALEQRLERVLASHPRVLCELRMDCLDLHPPAAFAFLARLPAHLAPRLVITQRLKASGPLAQGGCGWDALTWQSWWRDVMALRPWFAVDIDWVVVDRLAGESLAWQGKFRSRHALFSLHASLDEVEASLPELVASAREYGAGVKIACPVEGAADLARLAALGETLQGLPFRVVAPMGSAGRAWRWSRMSGDITYFSAESGRVTAPGQDALATVLPYLSTRQRPDLYLLLGDNPDNRYGEERWNRAFLKRGATSRYLSCATSDAPGALWAENALKWMSLAGVKGASVTKPYKLSFPSPTNTLKRVDQRWERANTDGAAVAELLRQRGVNAPAGVVVAGGGGAARAVEEGLREAGYEPRLWVRDEGRLGPCPDGLAFVSTWPGEYQEALVRALPERTNFQLILDAQFSRAPGDSPLQRWGSARGISYLAGARWWREQARRQDLFWFGENRLGAAEAELLAMVPASKSETLRALALAAATGVATEIHGPALNEDTEVFAQALEALGFSLDRGDSLWRIFPPKRLRAPEAPLILGEGATGFRILAALSTLMEEGSTLRLGAVRRLLERPWEELRRFGAAMEPEALALPTGQALPTAVSVEQSSQFATGFLLAAAGLLYRGKLSEYTLTLEGELRSAPYLRLTQSLLLEAGVHCEIEGATVRLRLAERKTRLRFTVERDASSLAFLEVIGQHWRLASFCQGSRQGDGEFPDFLRRLGAGEPVSLKHHPDLAPPLWAAAALGRHCFEVQGTPQLHWKESDRARLLVEAATALGVRGEERPDGFLVDFRQWVPSDREIFLKTDGDHRLAMAFGLLGIEEPGISPDRRDCVKKSFPRFWQAIALLEEAMPG